MHQIDHFLSWVEILNFVNYLNFMNLKKFFLLFLLISFNACAQSTAFLGPAITIASTGNTYNAGMQVMTNSAIKKETGKDAVTHIKDKIEKDQKDKKFKKNLRNLVKKRFELTRKKLNLN